MTSRYSASYRQLLELFHSGRELTLKEAAQQLGLSERQIQRLIKSMQSDGVPVRSTAIGKAHSDTTHSSTGLSSQTRIYYIDGHDREVGVRITLTDRQAFALAVAAEATRSVFAATPLGEDLSSAFAHLLEMLPADIATFEAEEIPTQWDFSSGSSVALNPDVFVNIARAINECRIVAIDYHTASTNTLTEQRLIEPYGLAVRNGSWLLIAWCRKRREIRDFSLSGISRLVVQESFFIRPPEFNLKHYLNNRFSAVGGKSKHTVRLIVEPNRAVYFRRKRYHHSQHISRENNDGSIEITYTVEGLKEMRSFVQGWGTALTVVEPQELRDTLLTEARAVVERYTEVEA